MHHMRRGTCTHMTECHCRGFSCAAIFPLFWMSRWLVGGSTQCRLWYGGISTVASGVPKGAHRNTNVSGEARYLTGTALRPFRETRCETVMRVLCYCNHGSAFCLPGMVVLQFASFYSLCNCVSDINNERRIMPTQISNASSPLIPDHQDGRGPPVSQSWSRTPEAAAGAALHSSISQRPLH